MDAFSDKPKIKHTCIKDGCDYFYIADDRIHMICKLHGPERPVMRRDGKKEKDLEGKFQGLKTVASKVLAPIKSMWERLLDFETTIFLGRVAIKLFEWFSDKENQKKIKAIGRFIKDFWPALLAGYLLFGNALSKFIIGFGVKLVAWSAKLIAKVIPALGKALAKMKLAALGKGALIAGGVVAAGAGIYGIG